MHPQKPTLKHCRLSHCSGEQGMPPTSNCKSEFPNLAGKACLPSQCLLLLGWLPVSSQPEKGRSSPTGSNCFGNLAEHLCPIRPNIHTRRSGSRRLSISGSTEPWKGLHSQRRGSRGGVASGEQPPGARSHGGAVFCSLPVTSCRTKPQGLRRSSKLQGL